MQTRKKPLFRFAGMPEGGIGQQFDAASLAQQFYFLLGENGLHGRIDAVRRQFGPHLEQLKKHLQGAGVTVADLAWFAELLQ